MSSLKNLLEELRLLLESHSLECISDVDSTELVS